MNRVSLAIALSMGALALLLWWVVNRPGIEPPWPTQVAGFSFSPQRLGQDPGVGQYPSIAEIDEDLALLAGDAYAVRTYSVQSTLAEIPRLAVAHGLNVALGAWLTGDPTHNATELQRLSAVFRENHEQIVRVIVGNETLLREDLSIDELTGYLKAVKREVWAPVSTAEPWHIWLEHPELVDAVDFIAVHLLPYWEGVDVDRAVDHVLQRYGELRAAYPDKPIVISEVGWPSNGRTIYDAVASPANQARFLRRFLAAAEREDLTYYLMEAFDQPWKHKLEGAAGAHWGVFGLDREPKFAFTSPIVPVPHWTALAAVSIGLSVLVLGLLLRDSQGLSASGRGFLALVAYAITTFVVWLLYDFAQEYMSTGMLIIAGVLLISALGVVLVLLAEAHEWAEAVWRRQRRQTTMPAAALQDQPKVSIHVPAYNEPPEMLKASLDALARLDYPDFEVLVVDNNTRDPAVWQPVAEHCAELGSRFRFFHVAPLDGFKAGALNFALRETAPDAEVVAVIDADYRVESNWLRDLVPLFGDSDTAIVQAPQDYRDGGESLFKSMCEAEYRGFFQIGMITRNERDAIIQHGTMTMVRKSALHTVNGWSEWCITEDAELGLKLFEQGKSAVYVPRSYGRGLMPDTFLDFKKQRFRWAYGAVLILRAHLLELTGLRKTALTPGQRYHFIAGWLPWLADGLNLFFNLAAIVWTTAMIVAPDRFAPPHPIFVALPLTLFLFKLTKLLFLYRWRIGANLRESLGAGLAGLALSHVIARAMLTGFVNRGVGFFRTPKRARSPGVWRALADAREELLFVAVLVLGALVVQLRDDGDLLDVRLWATLLLVQAVPYLAAVLLSLISALPTRIGRRERPALSDAGQPAFTER